MLVIVDNSSENTLGKTVYRLFEKYPVLNGKEIIINSNSGTTQTVFLDAIEKVVIYNQSMIFYGIAEADDFLNLNNVLSLSIVGEEFNV